ncbi:MAG: peptidylprolyl isomerase [Planctomycetota bacterium]
MTYSKRLGKLRWWNAVPVLLVAGGLSVIAIAGDTTHGSDAPAAAVPGEPGADAVVVTVNDRHVTRGEIDRALEAGIGVPLSGLPAEQRARIREQFSAKAEERIVDEILLAAAAEKEGLLASAEEVDATVERLRSGMPEGTSFEEQLRSANLTEETLRNELGKSLGIEKLLRRATETVAEPAPEAVERFHAEHPDLFREPESVEARHILIAADPKAGDEAKEKARKQADEVREALAKAGGRFAELAAEYSACPSGKKGGDLGRFERGQMVPEFEAAAFAQKEGEIGAVVETPYGFHIIQVQSHEAEKTVSLEEARPKIVRHLEDESRRDAMERYVRSLRDGAKIVRMAAGS